MYVISHSFAPPNEGDKMCAHNAASAASASAAAASARRRDADIAPRAETCARWAEEAVRDRVGPPVLEKEKQQKNATRPVLRFRERGQVVSVSETRVETTREDDALVRATDDDPPSVTHVDASRRSRCVLCFITAAVSRIPAVAAVPRTIEPPRRLRATNGRTLP
jgi:hypothetical protein